MGAGSDDCRIPDSGEAAGSSGEEADVTPLGEEVLDLSHLDLQEGDLDDAGCFTEAYLKRVLPPIPDWMRKPPKLNRNRKQQTLFDGLDE